jgi:hypothetical protein
MSDCKIGSPKSRFTRVLLSGIILLSFPFLILPVALIIKLWRKCVALLAKLFKPSFGRMLSTLGVLFVADDVYGLSQSNILIHVSSEGDLTAEHYRVAFLELEERANSEEEHYPELKQGLTSWMGYWFFQNDADFDIKNHIKEYHNPHKERYTEEDLIKIKEELIQRRWRRGGPLWEIIVIKNYFPEGSIIPHTATIPRFHHALADGISLVIWFKKLLRMKDLQLIVPIPNWPKITLYQKLCLSLKLPFQLALTVVDYLLAKYPESRFIGRRNNTKQQGKSSDSVCYFVQTRGIPMENIRRIKEHFNVGFSSVIMAGITGFLYDLMERQDNDGKPEERTMAYLPFPIPRTSERLKNQM